MALGEHLRQQLAAKALKRQLERATDAAAAPGVPGTPVAQTASARSRFESMPQYQQVRIMREMGEKLRVESPFSACTTASPGPPRRSAAVNT